MRKLTGVLLTVILPWQMIVPVFADSYDAVGKKTVLATTARLRT